MTPTSVLALNARTDNDPLNKTDPLGLRPSDPAFSDPCWGSAYGAVPLTELQELGMVDFLDSDVADHVMSPDACITLPYNQSPKEFGTELSAMERAYCAQHPTECPQVVWARDRSTELEERFRSDHRDGITVNGIHVGVFHDGGAANAMKHLSLAALMTGTMGENAARRWLMVHELAGAHPFAIQNQVDRANNYYGVRYGKTLPHLPLTLAPFASNSGAVIDAYVDKVYRDLADFIVRGSACLVTEGPAGFEADGTFVDEGRCGAG